MSSHFGRRDFLRAAALAAPSLLLPGGLARALTPSTRRWATPNFSNANILRTVAGLRPLRTTGVRLETEDTGRQILIHNYGHGGSGYTMAWGSAEEAIALMGDRARIGDEIAVLGAGIIGLTTASLLAERGYRVTVYAAKMSPDTTSDLAGAQWSPSFVSPGKTDTEKARYNRILARTYRHWDSIKSRQSGVSMKANYIPDGSHDGLQDVLPGVLQPFKRWDRLPFADVAHAGIEVQSFLIEPPIYLPLLTQQLVARGVRFERRKFADLAAIGSLNEKFVVNCLGLGAATVFADKELIPMKGQLVHLRPDPALDFVLLHRGYLFCRSDAIVLGGSYERNNFDLTPSPAATQKILALNRAWFAR